MSEGNNSANPTQSQSYPEDITFIIVSNPDALKDRAKQQFARTKAILNTTKRRRQWQREHGRQFRGETVQTMMTRSIKQADLSRRRKNGIPSLLSTSLGESSIDPFETLPVNAVRLTQLLYLKTSVAAGEPIFNLRQVTSFGALKSVFGAGLCDPALTNALSMTLALADNGWQINQECLELETLAVQSLNRRLSHHEMAIEPTTISVVILFLGIEYRLDRADRVQNHLKGIKGLLQLYHSHGIRLCNALRRAIFWQDMLCSIIARTDRILDYTFYPSVSTESFGELDSRTVPSGFLNCQAVLSEEFLHLAARVHSLYAKRGCLFSAHPTIDVIEQMDSYQALLESQLQDMRRRISDPVQSSCILALFLCIYGFWDGIWNASLLPKNISRQLLEQLQASMADFDWNFYRDLLLWLTCIGISFAVEQSIRTEFVKLQEIIYSNVSRFEETRSVLDQFIWSDVFYDPEKGSFWEHIGNPLQKPSD